MSSYVEGVLEPCLERWRKTVSPTLQIRIAERWLIGQGRLIDRLLETMKAAGVPKPDIDFQEMFRAPARPPL